jgi:hypothetical protein
MRDAASQPVRPAQGLSAVLAGWADCGREARSFFSTFRRGVAGSPAEWVGAHEVAPKGKSFPLPPVPIGIGIYESTPTRIPVITLYFHLKEKESWSES